MSTLDGGGSTTMTGNQLSTVHLTLPESPIADAIIIQPLALTLSPERGIKFSDLSPLSSDCMMYAERSHRPPPLIIGKCPRLVEGTAEHFDSANPYQLAISSQFQSWRFIGKSSGFFTWSPFKAWENFTARI